MENPALNEAVFKSIAETLAEHDWYLKLHEYRFRRIVAAVAKSHPRPGRILDVGCWPGYLSMYFKTTGWEVDAIDLKPDRIAPVGRSGVRINGQNLNETPELPYGEASFDCIVFTEILEHLDPQSIPRLMAEFERTLRPGGTIILTTPNRFSLNKQNLNPFRWNTPEVDAEGHGHWLEYRLSQVEALFRQTELELLVSEKIGFYAHLGRSTRDGYFPLEDWLSHDNRIRNAGKQLLRIPRALPLLKDSLICIAKRRG